MPGAVPQTTPVRLPIAATPELLLLHVPPLVASVSVTQLPVQTLVGPAIADGNALTVTACVAIQPVPKV